MSAKIIYTGIIHKNKIPHLCFASGDKIAEIPVDEIIAQHFLLHLSKLVPTELKPVERGNDELIDPHD